MDAIPSTGTQKVVRVQVTFTGWPGINANSYYEKEITVTQPDFSVSYKDTVFYNPNGKFEVGLLPVFYLKDNVIGVRLHNVTGASITPADRQVWVTIIKNADGTFLPYSIQS